MIPLSLSSGATSILSKSTFLASPKSDKTLEIAAVVVVFPWSTCPIVPMFTWGLLLSNFSLAILSYLRNISFIILSLYCLTYLKKNPHNMLLHSSVVIMVVREGFEPSKAEPSDLQSDPFGHSGTSPIIILL